MEVLTGRTKTPALPLRQSRRTGKAKRWHPPEKNGHEHGHSVSRGRDGQVQYRPKAPQWKGHEPGNGKTDAVSGQASVPFASQFRPQTGTPRKRERSSRWRAVHRTSTRRASSGRLERAEGDISNLINFTITQYIISTKTPRRILWLAFFLKPYQPVCCRSSCFVWSEQGPLQHNRVEKRFHLRLIE